MRIRRQSGDPSALTKDMPLSTDSPCDFRVGSRRGRAKSQRTAPERERRCWVAARPNPVGRALRSQPASKLRPRRKGMAVPDDSSRCPVRRRSMDDPRFNGRDCKHHGRRKDQKGEIELHASHEFPTEPAGCQDRPLRTLTWANVQSGCPDLNRGPLVRQTSPAVGRRRRRVSGGKFLNSRGEVVFKWGGPPLLVLLRRLVQGAVGAAPRRYPLELLATRLAMPSSSA
jgi:hypothetical protein